MSVNPNSERPYTEFDAGTAPEPTSEGGARGVEHAPDIAGGVTAKAQRREYSEWDPRAAPGTYLLLAINIAVFVWMTMHGVSLRDPTPDQLLHYGANSPSHVLDGEWWRLVTAMFVHIGIVHIATNMWCLWNLGLLGEPLLGPYGMVAVYVLTGVAGNLLSVAWDVIRVPPQYLDRFVGAGASGAVFGIAGILIVLLSNKKLPIPWRELKRLRTSVARFAGINLVIGASTILPFFGNVVRIDNSAHIGGFLCGLALGPGLIPRMTAGRVKYLARQRVVFCGAAFVLSLVGYWVANLR
jgi:rhomboid protease GluP